MDTSVANIEFRGEDSEECNNFMLAVLKYAFTQGKHRDDEWVADFAATCLTGEALRWWTGLPPPTQGSWTLLRQSMTQKYRPSFYGRGGEEAEKFVQLVYERAMDAGHQGDNRWIAEFVPTCFKGGALRWFSSLDSTVRNDWGLLQETIFRQYPSDDVRALSRTSPTPAAAGAGAPANLEKPLNLKRGRVRVKLHWNPNNHDWYLSRTLDPDGKVEIMPVYHGHDASEVGDDILEVECDPTSDGLQELFIPDGQLGQYDLLAIWWYQGDTARSGSLGILCAVNSKTSENSIRPSPRPLSRNHWKIVVDSTSTSRERTAIIATGEDGGELCKWMEQYGSITYFNTISTHGGIPFIFEPLE